MIRLLTRNAKSVIVPGAVAAAVAAVAAGAPAVASIASSAPPTPTVIAGFKAGPVSLAQPPVPVATLTLPAGHWAIYGKADVAGGSSFVLLHCTLSAGSPNGPAPARDETDVALEAAGSAAYEQSVALSVTATFNATSPVTLTCDDFGAPVAVSNIKITAIKAGKLFAGPLS